MVRFCPKIYQKYSKAIHIRRNFSISQEPSVLVDVAFALKIEILRKFDWNESEKKKTEQSHFRPFAREQHSFVEFVYGARNLLTPFRWMLGFSFGIMKYTPRD